MTAYTASLALPLSPKRLSLWLPSFWILKEFGWGLVPDDWVFTLSPKATVSELGFGPLEEISTSQVEGTTVTVAFAEPAAISKVLLAWAPFTSCPPISTV